MGWIRRGRNYNSYELQINHSVTLSVDNPINTNQIIAKEVAWTYPARIIQFLVTRYADIFSNCLMFKSIRDSDDDSDGQYSLDRMWLFMTHVNFTNYFASHWKWWNSTRPTVKFLEFSQTWNSKSSPTLFPYLHRQSVPLCMIYSWWQLLPPRSQLIMWIGCVTLCIKVHGKSLCVL